MDNMDIDCNFVVWAVTDYCECARRNDYCRRNDYDRRYGFWKDATTLTLEALSSALSGMVNGFENESESTTLQLLDFNRAIVAENTVTGSYTEYRFEDVVPGIYTLKVIKQNHVAREYTLTVGESAQM